MEKQKLCWRCKEFYEKKFGSDYWVAPANHCHHNEPEEKPFYFGVAGPYHPPKYYFNCGKKL